MGTLSMRAAITAVFLVIACPATRAADANITLQDAYARIIPGAKTGAAYLRIANDGKEPDRLLAVSTPIAGKAEVHSVTNDNGVMKMRPAGGIALKPGETVELKPGDLHIMLMDIRDGLKPGDTFTLTLTFEKAGTKSVLASVSKPSGQGR